MIIIDVDY